MRQDISWWCFQGRLEPKRLIAEAKRIGYEGFELVPEPMWDAGQGSRHAHRHARRARHD
jgi:sugar phosphate isomerase/epimerase